jgi:ribonuclease III
MDVSRTTKASRRLGLEFHDLSLLDEALKPSKLEPPYEANPTFERLEFLGDAILGAVMKDWLYRNKPGGPGSLTVLFSNLVSNASLGAVSAELGLLELQTIHLADWQYLQRMHRTALLRWAANILEALIGAIFCDQGYVGAEQFILTDILPRLRQLTNDGIVLNPKGELQRLVVRSGGKDPVYRLLSQREGGSSGLRCTIAVYSGRQQLALATAPTRTLAEVEAAKNALRQHYGVAIIS